MITDKKILGIIPARGGSKSIPNKNLYRLAGKPLIQFTIDAAKNSKYINRTILSSDDKTIIRYCEKNTIDVPFTRPEAYARDDTLMFPVVKQALEWLEHNENYLPDITVLLQPTSPLRTSTHIDEAIELFTYSNADSVVSVVEVPHQYNPISVLKNVDGKLLPFIDNEGHRVLRRQDKPKCYARNGPAIVVSRVVSLLKYKNMYGEVSFPYIMRLEDSIDIDSHFDIFLSECILRFREKD